MLTENAHEKVLGVSERKNIYFLSEFKIISQN